VQHNKFIVDEKDSIIKKNNNKFDASYKSLNLSKSRENAKNLRTYNAQLYLLHKDFSETLEAKQLEFKRKITQLAKYENELLNFKELEMQAQLRDNKRKTDRILKLNKNVYLRNKQLIEEILQLKKEITHIKAATQNIAARLHSNYRTVSTESEQRNIAHVQDKINIINAKDRQEAKKIAKEQRKAKRVMRKQRRINTRMAKQQRKQAKHKK
jgi:hypothetical protein